MRVKRRLDPPLQVDHGAVHHQGQVGQALGADAVLAAVRQALALTYVDRGDRLMESTTMGLSLASVKGRTGSGW